MASPSTEVETVRSLAIRLVRQALSRALDVANRKVLINLVALGVIGLVLSLLTDRFLSPQNITNVLRQVAAVVVVGAAVTPLMVSRGLDLSVGGAAALSGCVAAILSQQLPLPLAFAIAVAVGTLVGVVNGILVVVVGINAVIATLGTMYVSRGSALLVTGGIPVSQVAKGYSFIGAGSFLGLPVPIWVMLVVMSAFIVIERYTLLGKYAVATGSNPTAAYLSGVPVNRVQFLLFALAGTMAGWAGVMLSSRLAAGLPTMGVGFEFDVIVATVLGGTSLLGGEGTVFGMVIGALIVGILNNGLNLLGVPTFWQIVAQGTVLVLAVGLDAMLRRQRVSLARRPGIGEAGSGAGRAAKR